MGTWDRSAPTARRDRPARRLQSMSHAVRAVSVSAEGGMRAFCALSRNGSDRSRSTVARFSMKPSDATVRRSTLGHMAVAAKGVTGLSTVLGRTGTHTGASPPTYLHLGAGLVLAQAQANVRQHGVLHVRPELQQRLGHVKHVELSRRSMATTCSACR